MSDALVVDDDYCGQMGAHLKKYARQLDDKLAEYVEILEDIQSRALSSGSASEALGSFASCLKSIEGELETVGETASKRADDFVASVDEADENLY